MIYTIINDTTNRPAAYIYTSHEDFISETFSPSLEVCECIEFKTHGKTYNERKASARDIAIEFQRIDADYSGAGLSYSEYAEICGYFEKVGKRYGLLSEFKENCII